MELAELVMDAMLHARQAEASVYASVIKFLELFGGDAYSEIVDAQPDLLAIKPQNHLRTRGARVAVDIRQALLEHAEKRQFGGFPKPAPGALDSEAYVDSGSLREALHKPLGGRRQANLVEQRRMEEVGHGAGAVERVLENRGEIGDDFVVRMLA
jgi:hypothetical protein